MLLHFYVEEPSAEAALIELVPRILADYPDQYEYDIFPFQGKTDLLRKIPTRLKAYPYRVDSWRVFILIDQDEQDCLSLKADLERIAHEAGLNTRATNPNQVQVINRIIVKELESWFFGDIPAIVAAYHRVDPHLSEHAAYRDPDAITGGAWERLERLLAYAHPGGLEKIRAAAEIARHMDPPRNRSRSFQTFRRALLAVFQSPTP